MTNAITAMNSAGGYYNDYLGLDALDGANYNNNMYSNSIYDNTGGYNPYMTGMYSVPQSLWNDPKGQMNYNYDLSTTGSSFGIKNTAQQLTIGEQCNVIAGLISDGKENEILDNFKKLEGTLKDQDRFGKLSPEEIKAYAKNLFENTTHISLNEAIKQNCKGNFQTGLTAGFHLGNADTTSREELLAEINGTKPPTGAAKAFGSILGAIAGVVCLGIPALIGEHG